MIDGMNHTSLGKMYADLAETFIAPNRMCYCGVTGVYGEREKYRKI